MSTPARSHLICTCSTCLTRDPDGCLIRRALYRKHQQREREHSEADNQRRRVRLALQAQQAQGALPRLTANFGFNQAHSMDEDHTPLDDLQREAVHTPSSSSFSSSESDSDDNAGNDHTGSSHAGALLPQGRPDVGDQQETPDLPIWIRLFHVLVIWLCTARGLSRDCANILLSFVADLVITGISHPRQVDTVRRRLGVDIAFERFVICPSQVCQSVLPVAEAKASRVCRVCSADLWRQHRLASATPLRYYSYSPVVPFLEASFCRPGFYRAINAWRARLPGGLRDVYDGLAWTQDGVGEENFMDDYCSINLAISLDWFEPFHRRGTPSYSIGVISLRIDNLPSGVRNRTENVHVVAILPGPRQASAEGLDAAMAPLISELKDLHDGRMLWVQQDDGIRVRRRVRARLYLALSDMPGRAKLCGFADHNQHDKWCPYCQADASTWVANLRLGRPELPRDPARHREAAHTAHRLPSARDLALREHSAAWSPLYHLRYWLSVAGSPVDVMHALHLGVCKRFVHGTLVDGKLLEGGALPVVRDIMDSFRYPRSIAALSDEVLTSSGGSPTAHDWSVLTRFALPMLLASHWNQLWRTGAHRSFVSSNPCFGRQQQGQPASSLPFSRSVDVRRLVSSAATLARLVHLCHSAFFDDARLDLLRHLIDQHLLDVADMIDPRWLVANHHALRHVPDHIRRFGPPRFFWFYSHERLNGFLKKANHNNRRGGGLEQAMHTAYHHYCFAKNALNELSDSPEERVFTTLMRAHGVEADSLRDTSSWRPGKVRLVGEPSHVDLSVDEATQVAALIECTIDEQHLPVLWPGTVDEEGTEGNVGTSFDFGASMYERILVKDSLVTRSNERVNTRPGGSSVVVRVGGSLRLAYFRHAFAHRHTLQRTNSEVTTAYVVVDLLEQVTWPAGHVLGGEVATHLGYHLFKNNVAATRVVHLSDVYSTFLSATARFMLHPGAEDVLFGASIHTD